MRQLLYLLTSIQIDDLLRADTDRRHKIAQVCQQDLLVHGY